MSDLKSFRKIVEEEFEVGVRSTLGLVKKVKASDWDYRPAKNMRTLRELTEHLIAIPEVDLAIMKESPAEEVRELEAKYSQLDTVDQFAEAMQSGVQAYISYLDSLSDDEFLTKKTKPFYHDHASSQAKWMTETLTHLFHHRAQFFNYLKELHYDISMFDLYV
ncbi:hypothetical protein GCM10011391_15180 [Pullulanibacillus camelliae]|uniref:DinB-like domain-containing protein n=1 Tax=Pullulanibacillus camelliae TaxID=1707096 RepID=A0A8J2YGP3_9BACL|nr:DinB family protein [Pullulanibacillus camelliae]GGE37233.1 hypothetical protein GCM10011391_15180 [Pullulanibacillus camelliae]